jgi:hypothetical protein
MFPNYTDEVELNADVQFGGSSPPCATTRRFPRAAAIGLTAALLAISALPAAADSLTTATPRSCSLSRALAKIRSARK